MSDNITKIMDVFDAAGVNDDVEKYLLSEGMKQDEIDQAKRLREGV